ncbi:MAG: hypothetical protein F6J89_21300 [Symploca sp. SIO1C4]|uniref:Uncharacterized protein n=1 Tax=Symploca sp. SIO1C4 TaxID=2607765 RepID=A0A6B3NGR0_9CYAN|nr:hypothetical protein [Symploca sp. SIO1C4]
MLLNTLNIQKNSVFYALIAAVGLTMLQNIDTLGWNFIEMLLPIMGLNLLLSLWREAAMNKAQEQPTEAENPTSQEAESAAVVASLPPTVEPEAIQIPEESAPQQEAVAQEAPDLEETAEEVAETSDDIWVVTELDAVEPAPVQERVEAETTPETEAVIQEPEAGVATVEEIKPLLQGFSKRSDWKRLCNQLKLKGYSKISNVGNRAAFLVNQGITVQMMICARSILINQQDEIA